ncbi:actin-domain-containing protein [Periconia macrospinosa]|uniref:Actin-like protein ARP6 n=1 Tax=Periconia macrospinosa TaxID=97972 RepID=A0A2V1E681_9PLEO|nr:actin-domain-containing protein [Periconia macrospinosa]
MPPKGSKKASIVAPSQTLVLDNGAYTLKAGIISSTNANPSYDACTVIPNCIARSTRDRRTYVASELEDCKDFGELAFRRPVEKGFIVNWEAQKAIWDHEFLGNTAGEGRRGLTGIKCDPKDTNLLLTEKPNCPKELQKNCDEIVFEQFEFAAYYRCTGPALNAYHPFEPNSLFSLPQECLLIIDTSYSDTTILPVYNGQLIQTAVRRLTVGGKLLTNYLKELSSLRHYNMMEETYLLNEIKEAVSFIVPSSEQFGKHLEQTWKGRVGNKKALDSSIVLDYVLPDYERSIHGYARPHDPAQSKMRRGLQPQQGPKEDLLPLGNERFAVPELLFNPSDIGIQEVGLSGAVMEALSILPEAIKVGMLANITVVGGNSLIPGFMERLESELKTLVPSNYLLRIKRAEDPIKHTWLGAARFASHPERLKEVLVSKAEYDERGSTWLARRFAASYTHLQPDPMRRIPRPQRAIDRSLSVPNILRHQSPFSLCRATSPYPLLRTTCASFSSTPNYSFLLGKHDPKKHQQLVRRWQKRLLGDSEPIGAHVDPFDPTSPVRISPEEQGDEVEVLADDASSRELDAMYEEESDGERLRHVGGDKWVGQLEEEKLAKEFEKLTMRTYTPLTHRMADKIEDLTGTMYTLRDDNLMMAQKFHDISNKPYTNWSFGPAAPVRDLPTIRSNFHRAVIEIYALKQSGKPLDVARQANRGVYDAPKWIKDVQVVMNQEGRVLLDFPAHKNIQKLLTVMEGMPEWETEQQVVEDIEDTVEEGDLVAEEPVPQMDPDTPAFKRAAVVKQDPDSKPFDFMSNRPVPRTLTQDPIVNTAVESVESVPVGAKGISAPPTSTTDAAASASASASASTSTSGENTRPKADKLANARSNTEVKWRDLPLNEDHVKFALMKRVTQLTGLHISDPTLTSVTTFGELYQHFCAAAKPKPAKLFSYLHIVGQRQAEAKKEVVAQNAPKALPHPKTQLSTLLKLRNVEILRKKPNAKVLRTKRGLSKVISRELGKGKIGAGPSRRGGRGAMARERWYVKQETKPIEGTSVAPGFGVPVSPTAAQLLKDRTTRKKMEWFESQDKTWKQVEMLVRERKFAPTESKSSL